jgi:hypothetical protein
VTAVLIATWSFTIFCLVMTAVILSPAGERLVDYKFSVLVLLPGAAVWLLAFSIVSAVGVKL